MRLRFRSAFLSAIAVAAHSLSAQQPGPTGPAVRLGLSYPRGTIPTVIVLPVDTTAGDSVRAIIQRDLDFSDRVRPLQLDASTLIALAPQRPGNINYPLFQQFHAAALVHAVRTSSGLRVALYDVAAKRLVQSGDFVIPKIPEPRNEVLRDSVRRALTAGDSIARDSAYKQIVQQVLARHPVRLNDKRNRRFIVRDSISRDSSMTVEIQRELERWDVDKASELARALEPILRNLYSRDSAAREQAASNARLAIHGISDEVQRWITGRRGIAQTRIAYVQDGRIRVVDSDGANDFPVTEPGLSLSPAWSPSGTALVYSTFVNKGSQIAMVDLKTGVRRLLSLTPDGLNITPVFSPDAKSVVYATGNEDGTNIVRADLQTGAVVPLTVGNRGDNASPTFSPDGRKVAFLSSRARYPEIYSIDADGSNLELVTPYNPTVRTYRAAPDWSPDGRAIAFEQQNGDFQVWVVNVRGKEMHKLTNIGENEGPSWAPDGKHMALSSTRGGLKQIWVLDTETGRFRQLTRNVGARLSAWSPILGVSP